MTLEEALQKFDEIQQKLFALEYAVLQFIWTL